MPIFNVGAAGTTSSGYEVDNSLRYNQNDDCLIKTFGSGGNRKKFTFSLWVKLSGRGTGNNNGLLVAGTSGNDEGTIKFSPDVIDWTEYDSGTASVIGRLTTNQLFRDYSAWSHLVFVWDSGNATAGNRMRIYHNGSEITSFSTDTNPSLNYDAQINNNVLHNIGRQSWNNSGDYNGYMSEVCFIDGQALDPTSFGEFDEDSGIWKPIDVSGLTFGTNGFYLDFEDSSALGNDANGSNNFTVNNLTLIDQSTDTPTNNYCTLNPLNSWGGAVLSEGNTKITSTTNTFDHTSTNFEMNSGKWYFEIKTESHSTGYSALAYFLAGTGTFKTEQTSWIASGDGSFGIGSNNQKNTDGVEVSDSFSQLTAGDIVQIAYDSDAGKAWFGINGTYLSSGNPTTAANPYFTSTKLQNNDVVLKFITYGSQGVSIANFGSPAFSISSGNSDGNGHGNFEYAVPSGYYALNSKNLAEFG